MAKERRVLVSRTKYDPAPKIGKFSSDEYNQFRRAVVDDLNDLVSTTNSLHSMLTDQLQRLKSETRFLKKRVFDLEKDVDYKKERAAKAGDRADDWVDFHDTARLTHPANHPDNLKVMIDSDFGQVTLPIRVAENKFFFQSLRDGSVISPADLVVTSTSVFDKYDADGLIDREPGGDLYESDPINAFDGSNVNIWERIVEYPLDSDVSEVEVEITAVVPSQSVAQSNTMYVRPFPYGEVDLTSVSVSPDLSESFSELPTFSEVNNSRDSRWFFESQDVSQVKIRLRQRNWYEENGKKVFRYGLEEVGLQLIEWERSYIDDGDVNQNSTFIVEFNAPDGYGFNTLTSIDFSPDFTVEDLNHRNISVVLSEGKDFSSAIWNSSNTVLPQDLSDGVALGEITTMYAIVTIKYVDSIGTESPFQLNTPAFLNGMGIQYTLEEVN